MFAIFDLGMPLTISVVTTSFFLLFLGMIASYFMITLPLYYAFNKRGVKGAVVIQDKPVGAEQIRRELGWSFLSMLIYSFLGVVMLVAWRNGYVPNLYLSPSDYGWGYFCFSIIACVFLQDVSFYFVHRLLHTKKLAKYHAVHHRSKNPTVFALYSFHPVEGLLHALRLPLMLLLMPVNAFVIIIAEIFISGITNAYGHLNHEPRFMRRLSRLHRRSAANATFHDIHHTTGRWNYGFYLDVWDRMFGTIHKSTPERFADVHRQWESHQ